MGADLDDALAVWRASSSTWRAGGEAAERAHTSVRAQLLGEDAVVVLVRRGGGIPPAWASRARASTRARPRPGWRHVGLVYVHAEHQHRGVGRTVVQRLLAAHPGAGVSLWVETGNEAAEALYAATGFAATEDRATGPGGHPIRRWERAGAAGPR